MPPDAAPLPEAPTPPPMSSPAPPPPPAADGAPSDRPAWLPEKFKSPEDLAKSYGELEKQRGKFKDEAKAGARAEVEAEMFGKRPEKPEAYELGAAADAVDVRVFLGAPPADFVPEPGQSLLQLNPDSKALAGLRSLAHRAGASNEEVQAFLTEVARENGQRVPTEADLERDRQKVWGELGEHGQRRAQHAWGQMRAVLGDRASDLEAVLGSAKAIEAMEEVLARATGSRFAAATAGAAGGRLTEAEIEAEMKKPEYMRGDPQAQAKVAGMWKTLYPG